MLITQNQAAERIGINRSTVSRDANKKPTKLPFFDDGEKIMVEDECPEWNEYVAKKQSRGNKTDAKKTAKKPTKKPVKKEIPVKKSEKPKKTAKKESKKSWDTPQEKPEGERKSAEEIQAEREKKAMAEIDEAMKGDRALEVSPQMSLHTISKMEKVYKAQELSEKALMARNKRLEQEKSLMKSEEGMFIFGSFMERVKQELGGMPHKLMPQQKALLLSGSDKEAEKVWHREFEAMLNRVIKEQLEALENWKDDK